MKNHVTKIPLLFLLICIVFGSCKSSAANDPSTLPVDISERPANESSQKYDEAALDEIKSDIDAQISDVKCTKSSDWTFAPIGAKACGGPVMYIAYPKKSEATILPLIEKYTQKMSDFNKKYGITSDCMMPAEPVSVRCDNGSPVLVYQ